MARGEPTAPTIVTTIRTHIDPAKPKPVVTKEHHRHQRDSISEDPVSQNVITPGSDYPGFSIASSPVGSIFSATEPAARFSAKGTSSCTSLSSSSSREELPEFDFEALTLDRKNSNLSESPTGDRIGSGSRNADSSTSTRDSSPEPDRHKFLQPNNRIPPIEEVATVKAQKTTLVLDNHSAASSHASAPPSSEEEVVILPAPPARPAPAVPLPEESSDFPPVPTRAPPALPVLEDPEPLSESARPVPPLPLTPPGEDLIIPAPLPGPVGGPGKTQSEDESDENPESSVTSQSVDPEKPGNNHKPFGHETDDPELGMFGGLYQTFRKTYAPTEDPPLILPSGPTDEEKYSYLHTNRLPLYVLGVFAFLSLSGGMWLFVISSLIFSWFGVFVGLLQIYLIISYLVGVVGKDFDHEAHKKILEEYPITSETAPTVDIYLPCCKEPLEVLENTYKHIRELEYPKDKLKVYVMDDGGMDSVKQLATSYGFEYICRDDRPRLKKAGNLRWTFAMTSGDFFTIYDADFCPRPDFLLELLPQHLADDKTAIVQSPQFFRTSDEQTWVEQGASAVQELFYRVVQVNRNRWGASICVGSNAIYRRSSLEEVGGTAEIGFSEDVHTGFGAVDRGWKVKYVPLCMACGICPDTPRAFFSQQMRWCMGSTTLLTNPEFWKSRLSFVQKICYLCGMMYYSAVALSIFVAPLPGVLLLWLRPEYFKYYNLAFALPSILYGLIMFRCWAKATYGLNVQYIMVIQSFAYLTAIKDRLFSRTLAWVPSGDTKAHKNNKYRNMRILAWCWLSTIQGFLVAGVAYRLTHGMAWYNVVPLLVLNTFNLFIAHRFLLYQG